MKRFVVRLKERSYTVTVGAPLRSLDPRRWGGKWSRRALVVSDIKVARLYAKVCLAALRRAGLDPVLCLIPSGEDKKNLGTVQTVFRALFRHGLDRKSLVVALGGGVVGDLAGFVAATALRGLPFVQIPTTLLAQVDASIGGKTGVDAPEGKNLIGAFHQPRAVWMDVAALETLPKREIVNGMAEVIKYGVIADPELFRWLEKKAESFGRWSRKDFEFVVARSAQIKGRVVARDEREESGLRETLNFGHTIGHAVETAGSYRVHTHGEAVALGMRAAAKLGETLLGFREKGRLVRLLAAYGLPVRSSRRFSRKKIFEVMKRDKKARDGAVRFVLPKTIGTVKTGVLVPAGLVEKALEEIGL